MQRSFLTLIPKPDKDPSLYASYRAIALLNSNLVFFTKLLSIRLNAILPYLIHKDQVGFVPFRQAGDNTRRVIDLIDVVNREGQESLFLGLDAEKDFDRLGRPFLFATLRHMGFRGTFLREIQHVCTNPTSQVKTLFALSSTSWFPTGPVRDAHFPPYCLPCELSPWQRPSVETQIFGVSQSVDRSLTWMILYSPLPNLGYLCLTYMSNLTPINLFRTTKSRHPNRRHFQLTLRLHKHFTCTNVSPITGRPQP